jgi:hypothetical protein
MVNTFGSQQQQFPLYDSRLVRENRHRFLRDKIPLLSRANSIYIPTGRWPTKGWLLMRRGDYNQLNTYSDSLQLNIGNPGDTNNVAALENLSITQAQCVTRGLASDVNALYLIEIIDDRGILHNDWFQSPIAKSYNIRVPAYPQTFFLDSMNDYPAAGAGSKTTWTWATMLQDIWQKLNTLDGGAVLGPWPGLPSNYTVSGTPEGFWFPGVSAWYSLVDILEHIGLTIACDLTQTNPFSIVFPGTADTNFTNAQAKYKSNLEDDYEWIDTGAGRVPQTVQVLFRRRNQVYGSEETVTYRNDTQHQWEMTAYYTVSFNAPAQFALAVGSHYIWSDFTVQYDMDNQPLAADVAMANLIAQERVTQYFAKIYRQTAGYMTQVYTGALPFVTGSQVDGVCYYQDYSSQDRQGWKTKIVRGDYPPFEGIWTPPI